MKRLSVAFVSLIAFEFCLVLPVNAQRGGGHSGSMGGMRGSGGQRGGGVHVSHAGPSRVMTMPSNGNTSNGRTVSRIILAPARIFVPRRNVGPGPIVRTVPPAPTVTMNHLPARQRPLIVAEPSPPFFFDHSGRFNHFHHLHRFHHFHGGFGFPFCSPVFGIGFHTHHFGIFAHELACFPHAFVSPFFFPLAPIAGSTLALLPATVVDSQTSGAEQQSMEGPSYSPSYAVSGEVVPPAETPEAAEKKEKRPLTLLQLKDGSMYGLTDYWLENGRLHYITSYGGENEIAIERIDLDATVKLNYERGVEFVLRPKPASR